MTDPALPDVFEGLLDVDGLDDLARDLSQLAGPIEVTIKHAATQRTDETCVLSFEEALRSLVAGEVRAVQLRYVHEGTRWCDTLMRTDKGTRLVRMAQPG
jgi:hypothetical protein